MNGLILRCGSIPAEALATHLLRPPSGQAKRRAIALQQSLSQLAERQWGLPVRGSAPIMESRKGTRHDQPSARYRLENGF